LVSRALGSRSAAVAVATVLGPAFVDRHELLVGHCPQTELKGWPGTARLFDEAGRDAVGDIALVPAPDATAHDRAVFVFQPAGRLVRCCVRPARRSFFDVEVDTG